MKKIIVAMLLAVVSTMAVSPTRVGPVSTYGKLKANGGKLVGSCPTYANQAVQVKGMSLFWSSAADSALAYYTPQAMKLMVQDMGIEVLRFAMGVADEKFDSHGRSYTTGGANDQKAMLKKMVYAAVENDIYLIIDWHIESSTGFTNEAKEFFEWAASEFGKTNNVIFEVWNEPTGDMNTVAQHANTLIPIIRKYSENLILVGSPGWSSQPAACAEAGINDNNYACSLHFYAATHQVGNGGYNSSAESAMAKGVPVFASEWGTVSADGKGDPNQGASDAWNSWMNQNKVSWTNWSASAISETSAAFTNIAMNGGLKYTASGNIVKGYLAGSHNYKDCGLENSIGSSSADNGFSEGVANGATTNIIDDMEDGDHYAYTSGWWSAFTDANESGKDGIGKSSVTNGKWTDDFGKEVYDVLMKTSEHPNASGNTSKYVVGLEGIDVDQGNYKWDPYITISVNLAKDTSDYSAFKSCKTISYKYKGAEHHFRVQTSTITDYNYHYSDAEASDEWKTIELTMDMFKQNTTWANTTIVGLGTILDKTNRLAWEVKCAAGLPKSACQPAYNYLYIDDVRCDGLSIKAVSGNSDTPTSSSSVGGNSSSSVGGKSSSSVGGNTSSSSVTPTSSSVVTPIVLTATLDIDDVEDGDEVLKTTGTWYAYNDSEPGGKSSITNTYDPALPGYVVVFPGTADATNGSQGFVGLTGIVWNQAEYAEAPFVALGLNTMADTSKGLDMSACEAISYRYKGAAHQFKIQDGQVTDYAYHYFLNDDAADWTTVVMTWDKIEQPPWTDDPKDLNKAAIKKMSWEVVGYKGYPEIQPNYNFLYVDDLKCVNKPAAIKAARVAQSGIKLGVQGAKLNIALNKAGLVKVQIFDLMGHVVESHSENMTAGMHQVSLENLTKGNYVVRVMNGSDAKTARISLK